MTTAPAGIPSLASMNIALAPKGQTVNCDCDRACTIALGLDFWHYSQGLTGPEWKGSNCMVVVGWAEALWSFSLLLPKSIFYSCGGIEGRSEFLLLLLLLLFSIGPKQ